MIHFLSFDLDINYSNKYGVHRIPANYEKFIFDYERSEFIECRYDLYESNILRLGQSFRPNDKKNLQTVESAQYLTKFLDERLLNYWISDGTMLGK